MKIKPIQNAMQKMTLAKASESARLRRFKSIAVNKHGVIFAFKCRAAQLVRIEKRGLWAVDMEAAETQFGCKAIIIGLIDEPFNWCETAANLRETPKQEANRIEREGKLQEQRKASAILRKEIEGMSPQARLRHFAR